MYKKEIGKLKIYNKNYNKQFKDKRKLELKQYKSYKNMIKHKDNYKWSIVI